MECLQLHLCSLSDYLLLKGAKDEATEESHAQAKPKEVPGAPELQNTAKDEATEGSQPQAKPEEVPGALDSQNTVSDDRVSYEHLKWIQI